MRQVSGVLSFRDRVRVRSVARITHYRRDLSHPVPTTIAHGRGRPDAFPGFAELRRRGSNFQGSPTAEHTWSEPFWPTSGGEC